MLHPSLQRIRTRLPVVPTLADGAALHAAVAALLRVERGAPELLLIRRAEREGDPWSGHIALPGGRRDPSDRDDAATAARETHEELGIDLAADGVPLGALDPVQPKGAQVDIRVAPFVWAVPADSALRPNHEVALAFWVPLAEIASPAAEAEYLHAATGRRFPALSCRGELVWGMTHRIVTQLIHVWADDADRVGASLLSPDPDPTCRTKK